MNRHALRGTGSRDAASAGSRREGHVNGSPARRSTEPDRGPIESARSIDAIDEQIIHALQENGREAFRRIAGRVGVSEATVRARYARLMSGNVLRVTGVTNPLALGFDGMAMVGIKVSGAPEPVADEVAHWPETSYVVITAGQFDILVELVCADRTGFRALTNRIRALPEVASTESFVYLEMCKQLYTWGARAHETADGPYI
jgi:Lrp/AsnC family transcriptional regulator, regulator for asnA, asnC and gidA